MLTVHAVRHAKLLLLIQEAGSIQILADSLGKAHSQISQLRNQIVHSTTGKPRVIGDDLAREIERKLGKPEGWMDTPESHFGAGQSLPLHPGAVIDLAQSMSESRNYSDPPRLHWGDLMTADVSRPFELEVVDGAFGSDIPAGCVMRMDPGRPPRGGWPALFKDAAGRFYLRDYQEGAGGRWQAVARVRGFAPLDSVDDGLQIVAVMKGVDYP